MAGTKIGNYYYKIIYVDGVFLGLNARAVDFLITAGDWYTLSDFYKVEDIEKRTSSFGMFLVSPDGDDNTFVITGTLMENKVLPTIVYTWHYPDPKDQNLVLPLYKYKLKSDSDEWIYEVKDKSDSTLFAELQLLCLKGEDSELYFEWTQQEIELSEMLIEYEKGID